ncbi:unnamed protein product [Prorocentrum cordatum]|nr:unnamed protein product [Polarella glacialis]
MTAARGLRKSPAQLASGGERPERMLPICLSTRAAKASSPAGSLPICSVTRPPLVHRISERSSRHQPLALISASARRLAARSDAAPPCRSWCNVGGPSRPRRTLAAR